MKHEILQPVRHFNMHDDPLTNIETIQLVLWEKGLCIAGFDAEGNVLTTKVYNANNWNIGTAESIFINEPLVAGHQHITHIWIAEERNLIVPAILFEPDAASLWLKQLHLVEEGETILHSKIERTLGAVVSFPVANRLIDMLYKYFGEGRISALSSALLCQEAATTGDALDITILDQTALFSIYQNGKLLNHQVIDDFDSNNLVYTIASISTDNGMEQEQLKVNLSGLCITESLALELKSFFPKISVPGSEQFSSFTFLSKLISCA